LCHGGTLFAILITANQEGMMVDNSIPTNQFHPYQPPDATPHAEIERGGLGGALSKFGLNQRIGKVRDLAREKPGVFLGGLAALVIGAGLMRKRRM
jgi:hypothetical protein